MSCGAVFRGLARLGERSRGFGASSSRVSSISRLPRIDRQQVVEVVRDAAGQLADRLHLLGLPELLFDPLGRSDVADESREEAARRGFDLSDSELHWKVAAVLAPPADDAPDADDPLIAGAPVAFQVVVVLAAIGLGHEHADVAPHHLFGRIPEKALGGAAEGLDDTGLADRDQSLGRGIENGPEARLALAQSGFGLLSGRDVDRRRDRTRQDSARLTDGRSVVEKGDRATVFEADLPFLVPDVLAAQGAPDRRVFDRDLFAVLEEVAGRVALRRGPEGSQLVDKRNFEEIRGEPVGSHLAHIGIAREPDRHRGRIDKCFPLDRSRLECLLGGLACRQVESKGRQGFATVDRRQGDQDRDAPTVANVFLLVYRGDSVGLGLRDSPLVGQQPLVGGNLVPTDPPRHEVVPGPADQVEIGPVRFDDAPVGRRENGPDGKRFEDGIQAGLARLPGVLGPPAVADVFDDGNAVRPSAVLISERRGDTHPKRYAVVAAVALLDPIKGRPPCEKLGKERLLAGKILRLGEFGIVAPDEIMLAVAQHPAGRLIGIENAPVEGDELDFDRGLVEHGLKPPQIRARRLRGGMIIGHRCCLRHRLLPPAVVEASYTNADPCPGSSSCPMHDSAWSVHPKSHPSRTL